MTIGLLSVASTFTVTGDNPLLIVWGLTGAAMSLALGSLSVVLSIRHRQMMMMTSED